MAHPEHQLLRALLSSWALPLSEEDSSWCCSYKPQPNIPAVSEAAGAAGLVSAPVLDAAGVLAAISREENCFLLPHSPPPSFLVVDIQEVEGEIANA